MCSWGGRVRTLRGKHMFPGKTHLVLRPPADAGGWYGVSGILLILAVISPAYLADIDNM